MAEQEGGLFNKIIEKSKRRDSFNREHFNLPTAEMVASQANQLKKDLYANSVKWLLKNLQNCEELKNINNDADRKFIAFVVIATTSYNQTYPLSRTEATELQEMLNKLDLLQKFKLKKAVENVQKMNLGVAALNYGYYEMVQKTPFKKMNELDAKTNNWIVEDKSRLVPYQGLGVIGPQSIYFNTNNFYKSPEEFFQDDEFFNSSQFDLHDLVHYGVGASNPNFASKYYPTYNSEDEVCEAGLISLPLELQHLITSNPKNENLKSDGYILTNLTFQWFYEKFEQLGSPINIQKKDQTNIVEYISDKLKAYLLENRINIIELAVLMQNKLYEATASECETAVFVRGGKDNTRGRAHLDPLFNKNAFEIIEIVAKAATQPDFRFHHEHRNTLRNRAQVLAYKKVAQEFHSRAQKDGKNINPGYLIMCKKIQSAGSKPVATNLFNDVYNLLRNNA